MKLTTTTVSRTLVAPLAPVAIGGIRRRDRRPAPPGRRRSDGRGDEHHETGRPRARGRARRPPRRTSRRVDRRRARAWWSSPSMAGTRRARRAPRARRARPRSSARRAVHRQRVGRRHGVLTAARARRLARDVLGARSGGRCAGGSAASTPARARMTCTAAGPHGRPARPATSAGRARVGPRAPPGWRRWSRVSGRRHGGGAHGWRPRDWGRRVRGRVAVPRARDATHEVAGRAGGSRPAATPDKPVAGRAGGFRPVTGSVSIAAGRDTGSRPPADHEHRRRRTGRGVPDGERTTTGRHRPGRGVPAGGSARADVERPERGAPGAIAGRDGRRPGRGSRTPHTGELTAGARSTRFRTPARGDGDTRSPTPSPGDRSGMLRAPSSEQARDGGTRRPRPRRLRSRHAATGPGGPGRRPTRHAAGTRRPRPRRLRSRHAATGPGGPGRRTSS